MCRATVNSLDASRDRVPRPWSLHHPTPSHQNSDRSHKRLGDTPWHGFGQKLAAPATAEEAIAAAHLDWDVALEPVYSFGGMAQGGFGVEDPYRFVRRQDNKAILGLRTSRYTVVQNRDSFGLFDAVVGPGQGVYHTAGALRGGNATRCGIGGQGGPL